MIIEPIRVFVGCDPNNCDLESQAVLEHTIRSRTGHPVEITWMQLSRDPSSPFYSSGNEGWQTEKWATPFSGFRWAVPELAGFLGRAIYTDSDVIFLEDLRELWFQGFDRGKVVMGKGGASSWRLCVCLFDCARAAAFMPSLERLRRNPHAHAAMLATVRRANWLQPFAGQWNYCDNEDRGPLEAACAVHYTAIDTQPQLRYALPRLEKEGRRHWFNGTPKPHPRPEIVELFDREYEAAKAAGYLPENYRVEPFGDFRKQNLKHYRGRHVRAA